MKVLVDVYVISNMVLYGKATILYITYGIKPHQAHRYQLEALRGLQVHLWRKLVPLKLAKYPSKHCMVLTEGWRPSVYGCLLKMMGLARIHINILFGDFIKNLLKNILWKGAVISLYKTYLDAAIANSSLSYELARKTLRLDKEKIFICWPINPKINLFKDVKPNIDDEHLKICYLGHITWDDGADFLTKIYAELKKEVRKVRMYVVGVPQSKEHYSLFEELFKA